MNYYRINEGIRFLNLFICSYFATYFFSVFIGISSGEAKVLGLIMLSINILISSKRLFSVFIQRS